MKTINLLGGGRVGTTLAKLFINKADLRLQVVINRHLANSQATINFVGQGKALSSVAELPQADITLISVPDDIIASTCQKLVATKVLQPGSILFHCSGSLSSEILKAARTQGCFIASVHPIKSFANPSNDIKSFAGTYCSLEGDTAALTILEPLFQAIGAKTFRIQANDKTRYHAGLVFASNYLVTLFDQASTCLNQATIDKETGIDIVLSLMQGTLDNLKHLKSAEKALTGPIKRGDVNTVQNHLADLTNKELYRQLALATMQLTSDSKQKQLLSKALKALRA